MLTGLQGAFGVIGQVVGAVFFNIVASTIGPEFPFIAQAILDIGVAVLLVLLTACGLFGNRVDLVEMDNKLLKANESDVVEE